MLGPLQCHTWSQNSTCSTAQCSPRYKMNPTVALLSGAYVGVRAAVSLLLAGAQLRASASLPTHALSRATETYARHIGLPLPQKPLTAVPAGSSSPTGGSVASGSGHASWAACCRQFELQCVHRPISLVARGGPTQLHCCVLPASTCREHSRSREMPSDSA